MFGTNDDFGGDVVGFSTSAVASGPSMVGAATGGSTSVGAADALATEG